MNYFQPYPTRTDNDPNTAWESQVKESAQTPWLEKRLIERANELVPLFVAAYRELRALPRSARRTVQRQLSRSAELRDILRQSTHQPLAAELQRKLAYSLAGAALLLALGQGVAAAATITVNTKVPGIAADGKCSLIEAIINANNDAATHPDCVAGAGPDTIILPTGSSIRLAKSYNSAYGAAGLPAITSAITIEGNGSKIAGKKGFRLINVTKSGDLAIDKVTLSGGQQDVGGAAYNYGALTLTNCTITGNKAVNGAGLYNAAGGFLTIEGCMFSKNSAIYGGGVFNYGGTVTIENSTFSGNSTHYGGAGVNNRLGTLAVQNSTFTGNKGSRGGGIYHQAGVLTVENTVVSKNATSEFGGGLMSAGGNCTVTIENSTISGNATHYDGGGIHNSGCTLTIRKSTISGNKAGDLGGGITNSFGEMTIENSTITANSANHGGGIWNQDAATLTDSTISGNTAKLGGGLFNSLDQLTLRHSLISGNKAGVGAEFYNLSRNTATVVANDFNLLGTNSNAGIYGFTPGASDIVPGVPVTSIIAPLSNNGGPTMTIALVPGSPAIDAIPGADPECTADTDQRGTLRPQGAGCDIGAFEK